MSHTFTCIRFLPCLLAMFWSFISYGQGTRTREYSRVFDTYYFRGPVSYTGSFGLASYRGDLSNRLFGTLRPSFSVGANYKLWPRTIFGAEFFYFHMASKDFTGKYNLGFKSSDMELDLYGRLLLIDDLQRKGSDKLSKPGRFKPYIMSGIGLLKYKPTSYYIIDSGAVQKEGIKYPRWGVVIPVGLGLSVFINHRVSVIAEVNYRITFSDYLDDVSKRADPKTKDGYTSMSLKVQYTPTAPKARKKKVATAPTPYEGPKGTDTWKNKKKKPKEVPYEENQEQTLPQENNKENNPENTDPNNNNGGKNIENQIDEPGKEKTPDEVK
ncbi:MAG TPA: hypothetical protein VNW99_06125 [Cytophagaceae bacterium]|jgi:hypothetical protein|nr:hypothetical protein [Cytophagaceae bacterium]